ncbi:MAG TPA: vWA domain-containing protein [Gemmataceae bacterium]|nr:vWA domain-containing protein [Gemmataceae bacterium]
MAGAFSLSWKLDRPYVEPDKPEDVHALVSIEPNPTVLEAGGPVAVHLILLVDVSGSMGFLVRHDPKAQSLGQKITEGRTAQHVVSEVPSRREMARAIVRKLAERLGPDDLFTLVAFDDRVHVVAQELNPSDLDGLTRALKKLPLVGGGGTALGRGLEAIRAILQSGKDAPRIRKLIVLTDGEDQEPAQALAQAQSLGTDMHLPIVAFGMGECKVAFLTDVAKTTLAGGFNHIRHEADAEQLYHQALTGQQNVRATGVSLKLWLAPDVQAGEFYRTRPEILFVGSLEPGADNMATLNLEQMERGKAYEFLFRFTLPRRGANQRLRIAKATLTFDLPSLGRSRETLETNIIVEYTADPQRVAERSGDVRRALGRAEVQRQVLFLQAKADALKLGTGTDRDKIIVANLLKALIAKFTEFGEQAMANQYRDMEEEFERKGVISQEMLNRSLAASSRAEEIVVARDIDF